MRRIYGNEFPPGLRPFVSRHRLRGVVRTDNGSVSDLEIVIDTDARGRVGPKGFILGTRDTHDQLQTLGRRGRMPQSASLSATADGRSSIDAQIAFTSLSFAGGTEHQRTRVVAEFVCVQLTFDRPHPNDPEVPPTIAFSMTGNESHWIGMQKWVRRPRRTLRTALGPRAHALAIHYEQHEMRSVDPMEEQRLSVTVPQLVVWPRRKAQLATHPFIEQAIAAADDVAVIVSFLCGSHVTWYEYHLMSPDRTRECYRIVRQPREPEPDRYDRPVEVNNTRRFLAVALKRMQRLKAKNAYPTLAMDWTLSARESDSTEVAFMNFFFALESLRQAHLVGSRGTILSKGKFNHLRRAFRSAAKSVRLSTGQRAMVENRLPEINRPAFWDSLRPMLSRLRVKWTDLYPVPPPDPPPFIGFRNQLVHRGHVSNAAHFRLELIRLQGLVERLLLRAHGWTDFDDAPRGYYHDLLRTKRGDE